MRKKFDLKAVEGIFLGYSKGKKGYVAQLLETGEIVDFEFGYFDETQIPLGIGIKNSWYKNFFHENNKILLATFRTK